jgi:hypothetical protein
MIKLLYNKISNANDDDLIWKANDIETYNKFSQHIEYKEPIKEPEIKPEKKPAVKAKKSQKKAILKPLEIILNESNTFGDFKENVKDKLINFITQKEFNKVFGITKSSEIMSGIVNNRWNKSTALFISFLFNKSVEYNDAIVSYKKDEYKDIIYLST